MAPTVAVVGAGPLGLMALKNLKEDGFDVTGYDSRDYVGGLWNASDDEYLSVQDSTIFNSSKYRSAITDFPFPEDTDDYPTWQQMHAYFNSYCDHFHLRPHLKLGTKAVGLRREDGRWGLEVAKKGEEPRTDWYDKVIVAVGSFVQPKQPTFEGIKLFKGTAIHAFNYHRPEDYKDKTVLLVGLHATTQDVAVSLSKYASKTYASHKTGVVLYPRYTSNHATFDQSQTLNVFLFQTLLTTYLPNLWNWLIDKAILSISRTAFPPTPQSQSWNLTPTPSVSITPPLIATELYPLLTSGFVTPCAPVARIIGPTTIALTDNTTLTNIDAIIYCTGYDMAVPFLPAEYNPYPLPGEPPHLYRHVFPLHPDASVRNSLAILGQAAVPFPGFAQHELLGMAVSQLWRGRWTLPSYEAMLDWREGLLTWRRELLSRQRVQSTFYVCHLPFAEHFRWLDGAAGTGVFEHFGWWSWRGWRMWWGDGEFYRLCKTGLFSPAVWRLFDMGGRKSWSEAREQVYRDNEAAREQARKRREWVEGEKREKEKREGGSCDSNRGLNGVAGQGQGKSKRKNE